MLYQSYQIQTHQPKTLCDLLQLYDMIYTDDDDLVMIVSYSFTVVCLSSHYQIFL